LSNGGTRKRGALPIGGTGRPDGRVGDERPRDGERQVIFVVFREGVPETVRGECGAIRLAEESGEESREQYRFVNGGAEDPKGTE